MTAAMDTSKQREHVFWHELRSPAGTLFTLLDVMAQGFAGEAPPALVDLIERARRQAGRLNAMIAAAHDVERLRWGTLVVRREPVDLAAAVAAAVALVEPAAQTRDVRLERFPGPALPVASDPVLLDRCLDTLLRAAIEASARGGSVAIELIRREGSAAVAARVGTPAKAEGLAVAFTQDSSLGIRGGSGLGLYEIKLLVEAMGGSASSEGGVLELRLPL